MQQHFICESCWHAAVRSIEAGSDEQSWRRYSKAVSGFTTLRRMNISGKMTLALGKHSELEVQCGR